MAKGTVKWFSTQKGFGFIEQDTGEDLFFHINNVVDHKILQEADRVSFDIEESHPKGPKAINVELID